MLCWDKASITSCHNLGKFQVLRIFHPQRWQNSIIMCSLAMWFWNNWLYSIQMNMINHLNLMTLESRPFQIPHFKSPYSNSSLEKVVIITSLLSLLVFFHGLLLFIDWSIVIHRKREKHLLLVRNKSRSILPMWLILSLRQYWALLKHIRIYMQLP